MLCFTKNFKCLGSSHFDEKERFSWLFMVSLCGSWGEASVHAGVPVRSIITLKAASQL